MFTELLLSQTDFFTLSILCSVSKFTWHLSFFQTGYLIFFLPHRLETDQASVEALLPEHTWSHLCCGHQ
jgi:hypothetical protein